MPDSRPTPKRRPITMRLRPELIDRVRALARDYAGKPYFLTVVGIVEDALDHEIQRIEGLVEDHERLASRDLIRRDCTSVSVHRKRDVNHISRRDS